MQANLAKFNMMVQNEQIMEGSGDNNGEENTQINVDPEEIKRLEKENARRRTWQNSTWICN